MTDNPITPEMQELLEEAAMAPSSFSMEPPPFVAEYGASIDDFADRVMTPEVAREWDKRAEFPLPVVREAARADIYSILPLLLSQVEQSGLILPVMVEKLFQRDAGLGMAIMGSALPSAAISANGTGDQVLEWVPQCYGDANNIQTGALCVTEPGFGSDVKLLRTSAEFHNTGGEGEWELNGQKAFITNGDNADVNVVVATVDKGLGSRGHASFIVPKGTKGLSTGKHEDKCGLNASQTAQVYFDNVRIPGRFLLGTMEGLQLKLERARQNVASGVQPAMKTFENTRPMVASMAVGIAQGALNYAVRYAQQREVFGSPSIEKQMIAELVARMATEIDATRLLVWRASWMARNGVNFQNAEGSMSKLMAGELAVWVTREAIQILGGYGFLKDHPVERMHRDSLVMPIFEGTREIQKLVIASAIHGKPIR